jgi:hypothetical protein
MAEWLGDLGSGTSGETMQVVRARSAIEILFITDHRSVPPQASDPKARPLSRLASHSSPRSDISRLSLPNSTLLPAFRETGGG